MHYVFMNNLALSQIYEISFKIISNIVILLAIILGYSFINYELKGNTRVNRIIFGVITGVASILIMSNPWSPVPGLIVDTRTILFVIVGLHFGLTPSTIGGVIAILYQTYLGGSGAFIGVLTIVTSITFGLIWRYYVYNSFINRKKLGIIIFAFTSQILFFLMFVLELDGFTEILYLGIIYLVLYPIVTIIICLTLERHGRTFVLAKDIRKQYALLTSTYDSVANMQMFALDKAFNYLVYNKFHEQQIFEMFGIKIEVGMNFLSIIENKLLRKRIVTNLNRTLDGEVVFRTHELEDSNGRFFEERYNPIYMDNKITGILIFINDVSERIKQEKSILFLSYHDFLTGLYNRRHFSTTIETLNSPEHYPLSIIQSDINGLKIINDAFGHDLGDQLLSTVADAFRKVFTGNNLNFRLGGDEFLVLLPNTTFIDATTKIEKLKNELYEVRIKGINLTLSYGVATVKSKNDSLERIIKEAEDRMYQFKLNNIKSNRFDLIRTILNALYEKDPVAKKHTDQVSKIALLLGEKLNLSKTELKYLNEVSKLHDIGKIAVSSDILNKVEPLTDDEWAEIKRHPEIGYRIISTSAEHLNIAYDILTHHEFFDGTGYPQGLKGDEIPFKARIISVADAFDAMLSNRPYRKAKTFDEAIKELNACAGNQFDPQIIEVINQNINEFRKLFEQSK